MALSMEMKWGIDGDRFGMLARSLSNEWALEEKNVKATGGYAVGGGRSLGGLTFGGPKTGVRGAQDAGKLRLPAS